MDSCGKIPALLLLLTSPERSAAQVGWRRCGRWSSPRYLKISASVILRILTMFCVKKDKMELLEECFGIWIRLRRELSLKKTHPSISFFHSFLDLTHSNMV